MLEMEKVELFLDLEDMEFLMLEMLMERLYFTGDSLFLELDLDKRERMDGGGVKGTCLVGMAVGMAIGGEVLRGSNGSCVLSRDSDFSDMRLTDVIAIDWVRRLGKEKKGARSDEINTNQNEYIYGRGSQLMTMASQHTETIVSGNQKNKNVRQGNIMRQKKKKR